MSTLQRLNLTFHLKQQQHNGWKTGMYLMAFVKVSCSLKSEGVSRAAAAGEERTGVKVLEDCVIKAHNNSQPHRQQEGVLLI